MAFAFKKPAHLKLSAAIFLLVIAVFQTFWMANYGAFDLEIAFTDAIVSNILVYGCFLFAAFSFNYYLPPFIRFIAICIEGLLITIVWVIICKNGLIALFQKDESYALFWEQSMYVRGLIVWILTCDFCFVNSMISRMEKQQSSIEKEQQSFQLKKDAELFKLRQQLHPHFLFNSLNSINALIGQDAKQARVMVQQLSDFLRNNLKKEDDEFIVFQEELSDLKLYLSIEQVRFGHRLKISEMIGEECLSQKIPPFLLQPLVENAVKYGLYGTTGTVEIKIEAFVSGEDAKEILFRISNPFDPEAVSAKGTGFGLASIRRRLYLLFSRNDLLHIEQAGSSPLNEFIATLHIPLNPE
jgi:hypothetical protein